MSRFSVIIHSGRVTEGRQVRGLTQAALARLAGVSRQTLTEIEGNNYNPSTALALRLAILLDTTVEQLFRLPDSDIDALIARRNEFVKQSGGHDGNS
ncbi:MAG TPA: helix-turn-helix domain-containing protein [Myxococcales bacterium]|nr:helix-turn-helix domain-containing protein [Myxococcales bacterium]